MQRLDDTPLTADPAQVFTLEDGHGMRLQVMDWGATWLSCQVPLSDGSAREVLLGHPAPMDHLRQPGYLGAIVGRYANRIAGASFELDGVRHELRANEGPNQLHGGPLGFDKQRWTALAHTPRELRLRLVSPHGDQGFPGMLEVDVAYRIEGRGRIAIDFDARCDAPCPVNLTSHAYFNLDGDGVQPMDCRHHRISIAASHYLPVDNALIPTGAWAAVEGSAFDLREPRVIGPHAYDHCFVLGAREASGDAPAACLWSADDRLRMTMHANYVGLQFYSGAFLSQALDRRGQAYAPHAGLALEPQCPPDSPHHPEWPQPSCVLRPGRRYWREI